MKTPPTKPLQMRRPLKSSAMKLTSMAVAASVGTPLRAATIALPLCARNDRWWWPRPGSHTPAMTIRCRQTTVSAQRQMNKRRRTEALAYRASAQHDCSSLSSAVPADRSVDRWVKLRNGVLCTSITLPSRVKREVRMLFSQSVADSACANRHPWCQVHSHRAHTAQTARKPRAVRFERFCRARTEDVQESARRL